jgi:hypothetical protein
MVASLHTISMIFKHQYSCLKYVFIFRRFGSLIFATVVQSSGTCFLFKYYIKTNFVYKQE